MLKTNEIHLGDCLELMHQIPDHSIDMVLADLPYGTTACAWDSIIPLEPLWAHYKRVIKDGGVISLTSSDPFTPMLQMSNFEWYKYKWVWNKGRGVGHLLSKKRPLLCTEDILIFFEDLTQRKQKTTSFLYLREYFKAYQAALGLSKTELIKMFGQKVDHCFRWGSTQWDLPTEETYKELEQFDTNGFARLPYKDLIKMYKCEGTKLGEVIYNPQMRQRESARISRMNKTDNTCYGDLKRYEGKELQEKFPINLIEFSKSSHKDMLLHPTQKPVALFSYLIRTYTNPGDLVLDNVAGSGTTAIAAIETGRDWLLIEKDPEYYQVAKDRITERLKQPFLPGLGGTAHNKQLYPNCYPTAPEQLSLIDGPEAD